MRRFAQAGALLAVVAFGGEAFAQSPPPAPETIAVGDWQLAPLLELRTRGEYWRDPVDMGGGIDAAGAPGPGVRNAGGVMERARLGLGADRGAIKAQLTLQDARAWGIPAPSATVGGSEFGLAQIAPLEAYVDVHTAGTRPSFVRFGRQLVTWGDGRFIGTADWSPTARPLDALRAHLATGNFDFEVMGVMLDTSRPLGSGFGDAGGPSRGGAQLYAAQAGWAIDPLLKIQLFAFARIARTGGTGAFDVTRGFSSARSQGETYTGSLRVGGDSKGWKYALEGAYQIGSAPNTGGAGADREAYAAAAYLERTFERAVLTPKLRIGGAYASGDDGTGKYKQFDPLLPDVHTWHGLMDVFAWSNVMEGNVRATVLPWSDTTFALEYRYAQLADKGGEWLNAYLASVGRQPTNATPRAPRSASAELGHEIDAVFAWRPWTPLELMLGYSVLLAGDGARTVLAAEARGSLQPNGTYSPVGVAHYGYLQATLRIP